MPEIFYTYSSSNYVSKMFVFLEGTHIEFVAFKRQQYSIPRISVLRIKLPMGFAKFSLYKYL